MNSFPEDEIRANVLNKFYQCLLAGRMPHKVRKLVVYGPKDSGKTSWFQLFLGIIPIQYVASITQEKQFSTSMIKQDTQIVFLDEWSENSLQSDMAKEVLQGGYMPKSTKYKDATFVLNNSPYYITTNSPPSVGADDDNLKRRIKAFETTSLPGSLPSTSPNVERWMRKNAMNCIVWIATVLKDHVDKQELWYEEEEQEEDNGQETIDFCSGGGQSLFNVS